ncbi:MAG: hypothetical protein ABI575_05740 [Oxalobacteraceae bacterium]
MKNQISPVLPSEWQYEFTENTDGKPLPGVTASSIECLVLCALSGNAMVLHAD